MTIGGRMPYFRSVSTIRQHLEVFLKRKGKKGTRKMKKMRKE
jgi:hypothetical protein